MDFYEEYPGYPEDYADELFGMYPDAYVRMQPHVQYIINSIDDDALYLLTRTDIDRLVDEAINRSGMLRNPPPGHSRNTLRDLMRIMFLRDLFDRRRRRGVFPPFFPPFAPFDGRDRRRRPRDFGPRDFGPGDRGPGGRGPGDRGPGDRGPGDRGPGGRGPGDRGPGGRGPGDRGPGGRGPGGRGPR